MQTYQDRLIRAILRSVSNQFQVPFTGTNPGELWPANPLRWAVVVGGNGAGAMTRVQTSLDASVGSLNLGVPVAVGTTTLANYNIWQHGDWIRQRLIGVANATGIVLVVETVFQASDYAELIGSNAMPLGSPPSLGGPTECRIPGATIPQPSGRDPSRRRNDP